MAKFGKSYPWVIGKGRQLPSGYIPAKRKKHYESGRPMIFFCGQCSTSSPGSFQLIPVACPQHFATGDVYHHLLSVVRQAPEHGDLKLYSHDLAVFLTSIAQQKFLGARHMLLDFLRPHMDVSDK